MLPDTWAGECRQSTTGRLFGRDHSPTTDQSPKEKLLIDDLLLADNLDDVEIDPLDAFFADGLITEVIGELKSGKEGTAYCCRAHPSTGYDFLAAKVFRQSNHRTFRNDALYREGAVILNAHDRRAARKKTDWGREVKFGSWLAHEYETLATLHEAGADVPRPLRQAENAILMEYIGDADGAAPALQAVTLGPDEVRPLFDRMMGNIELFLRLNIIHGDLSPYNVLYHRGVLTVIDFPQAVDPRSNPNALQLLSRDVHHIARYWQRYGVKCDPERMARHLWGQFLRSEL
jgi:RIO kinase 1